MLDRARFGFDRGQDRSGNLADNAPMTDTLVPTVAPSRDWTFGGLVSRETALVAIALLGLAGGAICWWSGAYDVAEMVWFA